MSLDLTARRPVAPRYVHPDYERWRTAILFWLDRRERDYTLRIARPATWIVGFNADPPTLSETTIAMPEPYLLERYAAAGQAPYVGRPFSYRWDCAVDQDGRVVAGGMTRMVYAEAGREWEAWLDSGEWRELLSDLAEGIHYR